MHRFPRRIAGMFALACLLVASPAFADDAVPFHATLKASTAPTGEDSANPLVLDIQGQTLSLVSTPGFTQAVFDFDIAPTTYGSPFLGTIVFTAATGDTLDAIFYGYYVDATHFIGAVQFTGGTGQFSGAGGSARLTGTDLAGPFYFGASIDGSIHY